MGKIIAFANQKGGVGKTTSAVNIAAALGAHDRRVLLVDCDPQGNATSGVGVSKKQVNASVYDILIGRSDVRSGTIVTEFKNLSLLASNLSLAGAEFELVSTENRERRLSLVLAEIRDEYDYIIIDCPPSLGILTINALAAADGVVIPMQCEYYALEGMTQLMTTIKLVKRLYNSQLELTGILITMHNGRLNLTVQVMEELKRYYGGKLFPMTIQRNVRLTEAPGYGMPIMYYDKASKGADSYNAAAAELVKRIEGRAAF